MKFQMQSAGPSNRFLDDPDEDERDSDAELGAETDEDDDVDMAPPGVTLHALRPSPIKPHAKPQERTTIMPKTKRANSAEERPEPKSRVIASPDERRAVDARILAAFNSFQAKHSRMPTWAELAEAANAPGATLGARRQRVGFALKRAGVSGKAYTLGVGVPGREAFLAGRSDAASSVGTPGTAGQRGSVTVAVAGLPRR